MIVRRFLHWAKTASPRARADAANALARAYVGGDFDALERGEAERALTLLLDDSSPLVRRALALAFADAAAAPHHLVLALADDQSDVSVIVLGRSPLLSDSELIDCATTGDVFAQSAIALRPLLSASVAAALAEIGARDAVVSLAINPGADVPEFSLRRMIERFGRDGELREAILARAALPAALRSDLVAATAAALGAFVTSCDWLSSERAARITREACEKATIIIAAANCGAGHGAARLVEHLRVGGQLTPSLMLRSLLSSHRDLFAAALCELTGLPSPQVNALIREPGGAAFAALCRKAGVPAAIVPAFRVALSMPASGMDERDPRLSRQLIERVLTACKAVNDGELDKLVALLRRFEAEAARDEARRPAASAHDVEIEPPVAAPPLLLVDDRQAEREELAPEHLAIVALAAPAPFVVDIEAMEAEMTMVEWIVPERLAA